MYGMFVYLLFANFIEKRGGKRERAIERHTACVCERARQTCFITFLVRIMYVNARINRIYTMYGILCSAHKGAHWIQNGGDSGSDGGVVVVVFIPLLLPSLLRSRVNENSTKYSPGWECEWMSVRKENLYFAKMVPLNAETSIHTKEITKVFSSG